MRQLGLDPTISLRSVVNFPTYFRNLLAFRKATKKMPDASCALILSPALQDRRAGAGTSDGHYFWQDLLAAKWVHDLKPKDHLDVGSRIDGFIAHLLTFMDVTLLDIRPLLLPIPGLTVLIDDIMKTEGESQRKFESVSSLHSIEHFGLGRYGDPINPIGHVIGLKNLAGKVKPHGQLLISFPIGNPRIEFDSQRILAPDFPLKVLTDFELMEFVVIPWKGEPRLGLLPYAVDVQLEGQLGLYRFKRKG
jgi:hypothetical protein